MASLDKLPDELLSEIASYLWYRHSSMVEGVFHEDLLKSQGKYKDNGLCSLRLCCRSTQVKTQYLFERAAFSTLIITLQAKSLLRLRSITHDPRFGKLVTKLVFAKAHHPFFDSALPPRPNGAPRKHEHAGYGVIELPRHGVDGVYPNDGLKVKPRVRAGLQQCFASVLERTPRLQDLKIEFDFMASFWVDSPSRQEQVDQQARDEESRARRALGTAGFNESHDHDSDDSDHDQDDWAIDNEDYDDHSSDGHDHIDTYIYADQLLYLVARAAQHQHVYISSLNANIWTSRTIRARTFVELAPAFQHLQHLEINFQVSNLLKLYCQDGSKLPDHDNDQPVAKSLGSAISALSHLKRIHLLFDGREYYEDYYDANIAKSLYGLGYRRFEHLAKMRFSDARFAGEDLYDFLSKQKAGIQRLDLMDVYLLSKGHWQQVLRLMLEDMPLLKESYCKMFGIFSPDKRILFSNSDRCFLSMGKAASSREEVLNKLDNLLEASAKAW